MIDFSMNHFELFGLPVSFELDTTQLDHAYRELQTQVHPDRFASLGDAEKRLSMQWATQTNEAYQTLKKPLLRARYLLQLAGIDTQEETNTAMPVEFLMEQMEWREKVAEVRAAKDIDVMEHLSRQLRGETRTLQHQLHQLIDIDHDYAQAALVVRKLKFHEKLDEEIGDAIEASL